MVHPQVHLKSSQVPPADPDSGLKRDFVFAAPGTGHTCGVALTPRASDPWTENFGVAAPFALGVEEELLLVDAANELVVRSSGMLRETDPVAGDVTGELFTAMAEARSEISDDVGEALLAIAGVRRELLASGARMIGAGVHPTAGTGSAAIQPARRYALIADALQGILRTPICGQHVHVGMPDEETAVRAYNGIRTHVPLINALAANSPFWFGEDSGLASSRTVLFRSYPRAAMAPWFDSFEHFSRVTREICRAGDLDDYTHIWWDVRIHPGLGTIEIRAADTQSDLRRAAAIAALIHCLVRLEAGRDQAGIPSREALAESSFQATRHGLEANLLDRRAESVPALELGAATLEIAAPFAAELNCETELAHVATMLETGCGAKLQRRIHADRGIDGLLAHLVEDTARMHGYD